MLGRSFNYYTMLLLIDIGNLWGIALFVGGLYHTLGLYDSCHFSQLVIIWVDLPVCKIKMPR